MGEQPAYRFVDDPHAGHQQQHGLKQRGEVLDFAVAVEMGAIGRPVILDGEIVAFSDRVLPFAIIQKRLGRREVTEKLLRDAPVVYFAFDLLYLHGQALFELERAA